MLCWAHVPQHAFFASLQEAPAMKLMASSDPLCAPQSPPWADSVASLQSVHACTLLLRTRPAAQPVTLHSHAAVFLSLGGWGAVTVWALAGSGDRCRSHSHPNPTVISPQLLHLVLQTHLQGRWLGLAEI